MIVSSGGICQDYEVMGLVVGFHSTAEGCSGKVDVSNAYQMALQRLQESAEAKGANGVIFVNFQNRPGTKAGCSTPTESLDIFAWGTAVKI
ncbi:MAG: heavy metal-binding domain-containing protein [Sodalinema sp.]|uniref:heavy metal-binding domain-containing protein n=1 Tax=Sodalinema sp. TaxID=3080550 RepID=UPI001204E115|nr:MAG: heavy metal-binding domain-containing protein [Phormidium sp. SL48-SHIP]